MDVLRTILLLPLYIIKFVFWIVFWFFKVVSFIIIPIVGKIELKPPFWLNFIKNILSKFEIFIKKYILWIWLVILLICGALYGYNYYKTWQNNKPKLIEIAPIEYVHVSANLNPPMNRNYEIEDPERYYLFLSFSESSAPVERSTNITEGINISPSIEGTWNWVDSRTLKFTPNRMWDIGKKYNIKIEPKNLLSNITILDNKEYSFITRDFDYSIVSSELYQNPTDPNEKNAIFEVSFSDPVDVASFEKNLNMKFMNIVPKDTPQKNYEAAKKRVENSAIPYKFVVKYDDKKLKAWVRSDFVQLPEQNSEMVLYINKGVKSSLGGNATSAIAERRQYVASHYRNVVDSVFLTIAEKDNSDDLEQILVVNLVDNVEIKNFAKEVQAWILPKDKPAIGNKSEIKDYYWSNSDDINYTILSQAKPLKITADISDSETQNIVSFKYKANPYEYIYVLIGKNIKTIGGYKAKSQTNFVLRTPDYPKKLSFVSEGSILSLKGDKQVPIVSRNINGIELEVKRVIPSQIQHLITMSSSYRFQNMNFEYVGDNHFIERFTYNQEINAENPSKYNYEGIDISKYLISKNGGKQGLFIVSLSSWNPKTKKVEYQNMGGSKLILVTDLGVISKTSQNGSIDIFVQSINTGKPVNNAKVSVIGMNGIAVANAFTSSDGHVFFESLSQLSREKKPVLYLVEKDGDMSFLPANHYYGYDRGLDFSRFNVNGYYNIQKEGKISAFLFSDRGVYRPGDTVNIGTIARAENWDKKVTGIPVIAKIYDPRGQLYKEMPYALDESGFNEISFTTSESSPTGNWQVYLYLPNNYEDLKNENYAGTILGSTFISIREFEPDRMSVKIELEPKNIKGWVRPNELNATIVAQNLFGTPAQDRRVSTRLILMPMAFTFNKYRDYSFYDSIYSSNRFEQTLEDVYTNEDGKAKLPLLLKEHERASYRLSILSEVFEAGAGRSVGAVSEVIVSPNEYLVGAKEDGSLNYIKKETERNLHVIAINSELEQIGLDDLMVEIIEQKYISVLTLQPSGVYKYQSKLKEILISSDNFSISQNGTKYSIDTKVPGTYKLIIKNMQGDILYKANYHVVGNANVERSLDRNSELQIKLSKTSYKNDEEIEISIDTPYVGSGLITIEKDKVYSWKWFKANTTSSVQNIKVPKELKGNGYVNIQFVRGVNSDEIFMSPLSYGVVPFKVENIKESSKLELKSSKLVKPGEDIEMTVSTKEKQRVVVFAVDEGILQVAGYQLVNPINHFFRKRELAVSSHQILDLILPEFSKIIKLTSAAGGGSEVGDSDSLKHLNPFKRKVEKPVTFWSGIVEVDGEKTFKYNIPDYFNGKLRVMAVAVSSERIGIAQTSSTVRNDFILSPNVPFMVAPNDEFEVTLGVSNNLEDLNGKEIPIDISLVSTKHVKILDNSTKTIALGEKKEGVVKFKLKATEDLGGGELIFRAAYEDKSAKKDYKTQRIATISIRPLVPFRVSSIISRMDKESESVEDIRSMYDEFAINNVKLAHSPFIISRGLAGYLTNYPHYCSEQLVSAAIPGMIGEKYEDIIGVKNPKIPYDSMFAILKSRQNSSGSIGLWRSTSYNDYFVSVYSAHFLIEAKENGIVVPNSLMKDLNGFLIDYANNIHENSLYSLRLRAYATYILTRQNIVTTNMLSSIQKSLNERYPDAWKSDVVAIYLASTYKMLKMDKEANELLQKPFEELKKAYSNAWWSSNYYDPLVVNSSYIYFISKHFPEKVKNIPAQALENVMLMVRAGKYTTTSSAMSILALDSYSTTLGDEAQKTGKGNLSIDIFTSGINKTTQKEELLKRITFESENNVISGNFTKDDIKVVFNNPNTKIPTWYILTQEGYDKIKPKEAVKKGLEIFREYTDENGNIVSNTTLGKKINVTIRIRSISAEGTGNIAVVDLLPGGFEVVYPDTNKKTQNSADEESERYGESMYFSSPIAISGTNWNIDYNDVREDRILIYGHVSKDMSTFKYQIKSTNVGNYQVAPIYAEAMYDREIQAISSNQGNITVLHAD